MLFCYSRSMEKPTASEQQMLLRFLAKKLKKYCRELWVYQAFAERLRQEGYGDVDKVIADSRSFPGIDDELDKQFAWLDELLSQPAVESQDNRLLEFLENWKPKGEPN